MDFETSLANWRQVKELSDAVVLNESQVRQAISSMTVEQREALRTHSEEVRGTLRLDITGADGATSRERFQKLETLLAA